MMCHLFFKDVLLKLDKCHFFIAARSALPSVAARLLPKPEFTTTAAQPAGQTLQKELVGFVYWTMSNSK
jgi:hypothetical protein